jgi:hypothetical protein
MASSACEIDMILYVRNLLVYASEIAESYIK